MLEIEGDGEAYHQELGALLADLNGDKPGRGYQLYIANRLFGQVSSIRFQRFARLPRNPSARVVNTSA